VSPPSANGKAWPSRDVFIAQVNFAVALFRLDPSLSEIRWLKDNYNELANPQSVTMPPMYYLERLNPHYTVYIRPDGEVYVAEDPIGFRILNISSVVRHHLPHIDAELAQVVADNRGLHFYSRFPRRKLATAGGLPIDPHRMADPGNRYQYACALIEEFTGQKLDWRQHVGRTKTITVTRDGDSWFVAIEPPSEG
jgi:hypothetical protein